MRLLLSQFSLIAIAARRLWNHRLLMGCLLVGLITAVALLSSIPLYADAVQNRLLRGELTNASVVSCCVANEANGLTTAGAHPKQGAVI